MSIQDLGSIGELLGAIATIATLIYLALQIKQTRQTFVRQSEREITSQIIGSMHEFTQNPDLARIHFLAMEDYEGNLTREERLVWHAWIWSWLSSFEQAAIDLDTGRFNESELIEIYTEGFATVLRSPGGQSWWNQNKWLFRKATQEYLDEAIPREERTTLDVVLERGNA